MAVVDEFEKTSGQSFSIEVVAPKTIVIPESRVNIFNCKPSLSGLIRLQLSNDIVKQIAPAQNNPLKPSPSDQTKGIGLLHFVPKERVDRRHSWAPSDSLT